MDRVPTFEDIEREHLALMRVVATASTPNQSDGELLPDSVVVLGFRQRVAESGRLFGDPWMRQKLRSIIIFWGAYLSSLNQARGEVRLADFQNDEQLDDTTSLRTEARVRPRLVSTWGAPREGVQLMTAGVARA